MIREQRRPSFRLPMLRSLDGYPHSPARPPPRAAYANNPGCPGRYLLDLNQSRRIAPLEPRSDWRVGGHGVQGLSSGDGLSSSSFSGIERGRRLYRMTIRRRSPARQPAELFVACRGLLSTTRPAMTACAAAGRNRRQGVMAKLKAVSGNAQPTRHGSPLGREHSDVLSRTTGVGSCVEFI